jgi:hypothetical protein
VVDLLLYEWNDTYGYLEHAEALYEASGCTKRPQHRQHYGLWGTPLFMLLLHLLQYHFLRNATALRRKWYFLCNTTSFLSRLADRLCRGLLPSPGNIKS